MGRADPWTGLQDPMLDRPTALAMTVAPLKEALQARGLDFGVLARRVGLDPEELARPNARYPSARIQRLWALAAAESGDPLFGLHVGQLARPGVFHALGLGIVSSQSLLAALRRIERYSAVVSTNGRFVLVSGTGIVALESRPTPGMVPPTPEWMDALVVAVCRLLQTAAGSTATPQCVRVPHAGRERADAYRDILGCEVVFDAEYLSLEFDAVRAAESVFTGNPELAAEADRISARYLDGLVPGAAATRVRELLLKAMPSGEFAQESVARALNQSPSTLQRRLRREGTNYQRLLDSTRHELALEYLRGGRHSLADVAFLLGFTDQSNFTRAFRRWTGKTPGQYLS
jgi:AraC-like DNA-binding protein